MRETTTTHVDRNAATEAPLGRMNYRASRHCGNCGLGLAVGQVTATCPRCNRTAPATTFYHATSD